MLFLNMLISENVLKSEDGGCRCGNETNLTWHDLKGCDSGKYEYFIVSMGMFVLTDQKVTFAIFSDEFRVWTEFNESSSAASVWEMGLRKTVKNFCLTRVGVWERVGGFWREHDW